MAQSTHTNDDAQRARTIGVILLLAAALFWSLNGVLIKFIYSGGEGPSAVIIAFYRSLFAGLCLLPLARGRLHTIARRGVAKPHAKGRTWPWQWRPAAIYCVVFYTLMTVSFVAANTQTEAANAIILQYTSTFWIFVLSPLLLGESARRHEFWVLSLAITGIVVIFVGNAATSLFGLINGLSAGLFFGLLTMMIRRMRDVDSAAVTVVNNLGSAALILPVALAMGGLLVAPVTYFWLVVIGVVQFGLPYYLYTRALVRVPAHQAGLITLLEPVLVPAWTYLALGETVPPATALGGGIILAALLLYGLLARRAAGRAALL